MDLAGLDAPCTNSFAVKRTLNWKPGSSSGQLLKQRESYAPYATGGKGGLPRYRVQSAPTSRIQSVGPTNPHRGYVPGPTVPMETRVSRAAPYGARLHDSNYYTSSGGVAGGVVKGAIPSYDSWNDPLLQDFFTKKFANPHPPTGRRPGSGRPGSASRKNGLLGSRDKVAKGNVIYKVAVTTGDKKNAGTDAKVFIKMQGTKGKLPKKQLTKKSGSGKKKKSNFKFNRGTTHIFKYEEKDIGDLKQISVETDGLTKKDGWYLDQVEIIKRNTRTGTEKMWLFSCQNWLSLHEGDCQTARTLYAKTHSKTEYEVVVVTGNLKGAGTDANVSVTLFGKTGQTPKLPLKNNNKNTFDRNHSDIFVLKTACVGPLTKVRIQHDNTGFGAGWYLDRIVVTDLKHPKWKFYFPCGQWLAKDEGDGLICRDLLGSQDPLAVRKMSQYRVNVFTGDKRGAGTDANVHITVFGENGDTGERKLSSKKNNFERGQQDTFILESPCVGAIHRVRIGHDNWGSGPGWYLDKVIVDDIEQNRVYDFPCGRWFAKDEDDGQIQRDLVAGVGPDDAPPGTPYQIQVTTGTKEGSGTSAKVFVILYGGPDGDKSSGKIWLNKGSFHKGRTDKFTVDVADNLSPLSRIDVGHDNSGPGPGWYLDRVMVNCPSAGIEQWFLCDKWLAVDEGDGLIERTLHESKGMRKQRGKLVTWFIKVYTSDISKAGTDANVHLVAYGKNKEGESIKSDEIVLDNAGDNFEQGQCDKFKREMIDIGRPYKIRVGHDNKGNFAGWHLDRVEMENMVTHKKYVFVCNRWLAIDEDDGSIIREMAAEGEEVKKPEKLKQYTVAVHTADKRNAGTDANVFINVFGDQGDSGERPLKRSKTNKNKFERGNTDEFVVEAVNLKKLRKIRVGHDGMKSGDGWFLDKVVVTPQDKPEGEVAFECGRWLDVKEDDGLIVREITAGGSQMLSTTSYHVSVKTGDVPRGGTDANVFLKIFGSKGDTGKMPLRSSDNTKNKFERGRTDLFTLEATDIGKLEKIRIGHDGSQASAGWFLDEVTVDIPSAGLTYRFSCHRWLDVTEDDGQIEVEIEPCHVEKGSSKIPYELTVWTGDLKGAGTDANVFIQMYGDSGKTEEYSLRNRTDNFERGQVDKFKIEAADVGPLLKVRIGHDGKGTFDGWFMEKMLIQRHPTKGSKRRVLKRRSSSRVIGRNNVDSDEEDDKRKRPRGRQRDSDSEDDRRSKKSSLSRRASSMKLNKSRDSDEENRSPRSKNKRFSRYSDDDDDDWKSRKSGRSGSKGRKGTRYSDDEDDRKSVKRRPSSAKPKGSRYDSDEDDRKSIKRRPSSAKPKGSRYDSDEDDRKSIKRRPSSVKPKGSRYDSDEDDKKSIKRRASSFKLKGSKFDSDDDDRKSLKRRPSSAKLRGYGGYNSDEDDVRSKRGGRVPSVSPGRRYSRLQDSDDEGDRRTTPRGRSIFGKQKAGRYNASDEDDYDTRSRSGGKSLSPWRRNRLQDFANSNNNNNEIKKKPGNRSRSYDSDDNKRRGRHNKYSDDSEDEDRSRKAKSSKKGKFLRKMDHESEDGREKDDEVEEYWFVCNRWFARDEDDKKIVRELLPTDEQGNPLDTGLKELEYVVRVATGDKMGAGTDANVFFKMTGEYGDTGERQLKDSDHMNKFERNQVDTFQMKAIDLGVLKKVKIRHDNKGGMAAWFLDHIEVEEPKRRKKYFFACQKWLATNQEDGQIARELVPVDPALVRKLGKDGGKGVREEIALETKAAMTTYHVHVYTSDKFGAGTDANVRVVLFGEIDDTGVMYLKTSKTNRDKFERNQMDEFVIEAIDIGDLKKIRIGHDNAGAGGDWHLDRVEIDCPSLGKKWLFPCGRWLAKGRDDGQTEVDLSPQDSQTEEYVPCIPYEITTYTSSLGSAGTDADVYVQLYGTDTCTAKKSLCATKKHRKASFSKGQTDKFVIELEDVGPVIEKLRIGHDGKGFGAGWHLDKVDIRRLKSSGKFLQEATVGSETFTFKCGRWLARGEDDGAIERELVPDKVIEETMRKDGTVRKKENVRRDTLVAKKYVVDVITGDISGAGTDANVFLTICGDKGDSGERKLHKSETHRDKFERGQTDRFQMEAVDLGKLYKVKVRHDNSMLNPSWFLDRVEVTDSSDQTQYVFHCERWLAKNKEDCKIDRTLYIKGYEGTMSSSSTLRSTMMGASMASLESYKSTDPFSKSPRVARRHMEDIPEGPTIPYTVRVRTGDERDSGTDSHAWVKILGPRKLHTGRQYLELATKRRFAPGSVETFSLEAVDVKDVKMIEVGHDGVTPGSGWFIKEVEVDMPTKGKHYFFMCKSWLARDKGDGKTSRVFTLNEGDSSLVTYKAMVPYEVTVYTGDFQSAGTDAKITLKAFGAGGATSDMTLDKVAERFERGRADFMKMELEDIAPLRKIRIGHDGKGNRPEWYLEKVEMRNMDTGDLFVFKADAWFSKSREDGKIVRDIVATVKGKKQLKTTSYRVTVKTSDVRGAGTGASVFIVLFGESGDTGKIPLKDTDGGGKPFSNNASDVFSVQDVLSLGALYKLRVWHDNKGLGSAWHLQHIEVEDLKTRTSYMFPCNRWLSRSDDDKQICRELSCANMPSPKAKDKVTYDIQVVTSDKTDAGTIHNAWLVLEGEQRASKEFVMENSPRNKVLRRGQTDTFSMTTKNLGSLEKCILGAFEREDRPINDNESAKQKMWHCHEIIVTNQATGDKYTFPCKNWISICHRISKKNAKSLSVKSVEESKLTSIRNLGSVKYEVSVLTGDVMRAGTDANVTLTIYGNHGDTGPRPLQHKLRNLFERGQLDKFQLEAVDLGDLNKIRIEHDNAGFGAGWFLDKVEVVNMASNRTWVFPCGQWLDKKKADGQISRELFARD